MKALPSLFLLSVAWTVLMPCGVSHAADPVVKSLAGRWATGAANYYLGTSAALTDKWAALGSMEAKERGVREGAVQIFDAKTGAWKRTILPPLPATADRNFGAALAIRGDETFIGATGEDASGGAIYRYSLTSGKMISRLLPDASDRNPGQQLGFRVAAVGNYLVASAPFDFSSRGMVYLFDLSGPTATYVDKIPDPTGVAADRFGFDLCIDGSILCASSPGDDVNRGSVSFYDLRRRAQIVKHQPAGTGVDSGVGFSVSFHGGTAVFGSTSGHAYYYRPSTGESGEFLPPAGAITAGFGYRAAIQGNLAIVFANRSANASTAFLFNAKTGASLGYYAFPMPGDGSPVYGPSLAMNGGTLLTGSPTSGTSAVPQSGAGFLMGPFTAPLPYEWVTSVGSPAPGILGAYVGSFTEAFSSPLEKTIFTSKLTGAASHGGKDTAAFVRSRVPYALTSAALTGQTIGPASDVLATQYSVIGNNEDLVIGLSSRKGTGIPTSDRTLWSSDGATTTKVRSTGDALSELSGAKLQKFVELVQSNRSATYRAGAIFGLQPGEAGTTTANDSAMWAATLPAASSIMSFRENDPALTFGGAIKYGQISPRLCYFFNQPIFHCFLLNTGSTDTNAAVLRGNSATTPAVIAQRGFMANDVLGAADADMIYSSFIGEAANGRDSVLFKAVVDVPSAPGLKDEGIWLAESGGSTKMIVAKGFPSLIDSDTRILRVIQYWVTGTGGPSEQVVALTTLSGPKVNSSNDQALFCMDTSGNRILLAREGDYAPGCGGAKYGVISRVDVDPYRSSYAFLATLSGASASSNLGLFTGNVLYGNVADQSARRKAVLSLRKGQVFSNQPSPIKSISLPISHVGASGAGSTGRAHAIAWDGTFTIIVDFANRVRQVLTRTL